VVIAPALLLWLWWVARTSTRPSRAIGAHVAAVLALAAAAFAPFLSSWRTLRTVPSEAGREVWASGASLVARGARAVASALGGQTAGTVSGRVVIAAFIAALALLWWRLARIRPNHADGWGTSLLLFALASLFLLP